MTLIIASKIDKDHTTEGMEVCYAMRLKSRSSESAEFERGRCVGAERERALIAQKLHQGFECLTAATFAVQLAKESSEQRLELVSRASNLLDEAIDLLREVVKGQRNDKLRRLSPPG
jgi:signal transduction histidine kinase